MTTAAPKLHVLLVEGDERFRQDMESQLHAIDSIEFEVHPAHTLDEALSYLSAIRPQLIILDLDLEDSQGVDTYLAIQKQYADAPVVVLADPAKRDDIIGAVKAGAQDVFLKKEKEDGHLQLVLEQSIQRNSKEVFLKRLNRMHVKNLTRKLKEIEATRPEDQLALVYEISSALMKSIHGSPSDEEIDFFNEDDH